MIKSYESIGLKFFTRVSHEAVAPLGLPLEEGESEDGDEDGESSRRDQEDGCNVEELAGKGEKVEQEDGADDAAGGNHDGAKNKQHLYIQ